MAISAPHGPGVYLFKKGDEIIYVGKAKSLNRRIQAYFRRQTHDWKIDALVKEHTNLQFITTTTEAEALVLEAQLVKDFNPKYNILLKSGQPFVYFKITDEEVPQLQLVRNKTGAGTYFGPFMNKQNARRVWRHLLSIFKLKQCRVQIQQGCLDYHIGQCAGICVGTFNSVDYKNRIELVKKLLSGSIDEALKQLDNEIKICSEQKEFEKAKNLYQYRTDLIAISAYIESKLTEKQYAQAAQKAITYSLTALEYDNAVQALKNILKIEKQINTIDCFDISHFQSRFLVGACIRFLQGAPDKKAFRRFKIETLRTQNDYAALQEIVRRRYKTDAYPDLMIIDGGKGQLSAVKNVIPEDVLCISLAKREERIFASSLPDGIILDVKDPLGKLCIAIRDYTHHFAISYHRLLRSKELKSAKKDTQ